MADEPSWDDIFAGTGESAGTAAEKPQGDPSRAESEESARDDAPPLSRRQLREQEQRAPRQTRASWEAPVPQPTARSRSDATSQPDSTPPSEATPLEATPLESTPSPQGTRQSGPPRRPAKARKEPRSGRTKHQRRGALILAIVLVVVLGGGAIGVVTVWKQVAPGVSALFGGKPSDDYSGSGNGKKVMFSIASGDIGSTIASKLAKADITKSSDAPYKILLANQSLSFQPGTYSMFQHMSAESAIARLQEPGSRIVTKLVIPEGTTLKGIISTMASTTKISTADIEKAAADYKSFGLPANATSLEGWLFPATYELDPAKSAHDYFQEMVATMTTHLKTAGIAPADYEHTIIFASLIQKEAGLAADYPKVARVFQNRIDQGMLLQSDATVAYGAGTTNRVTTTDAERNDASNRYNTYVHKGLPIGPISNPGDLALQAAAHPAAGSWLYFVTVNLDSGETVFSTTYGDHLKAVDQFQTWLRAHPSYGK